MVAAACNDIEADRGDLVGESLRGTAVLSGGDAMMDIFLVYITLGFGCSYKGQLIKGSKERREAQKKVYGESR
jgi:hypothetical protein